MKDAPATDAVAPPARHEAPDPGGPSLRSRLDRLSQKSRLPARVATLIAREISVGRLRPGDKLPTEVNLVRNLGVSRNVVREAVARLQSDGVLQARHGIGVFVTHQVETAATIGPDPAENAEADFSELFELRRIIEPRAAGLAAQRRTPSQLKVIRVALDLMQATGGWDKATVDADLAFHRAVAAASGNGYLIGVYARIADPMRESIVTTRAGFNRESDARRACLEHASIFDAIARGDATAATAAMDAHLATSENRLNPDNTGLGGESGRIARSVGRN